MAAPLASFIRYPGDGNYQGPIVRTLLRQVGSDKTETQIVVPISERKIDGVYFFSLGTPSAITAGAQNGTSTAFFWLQNPTASTKMATIRRIDFRFSNITNTAIVHDSAPRIGLVRGTFTGTFSGATATLAKRRTADASSSADVRTAATGATVAVSDVVWSAIVSGNDVTGGVDVLRHCKLHSWAPKREDELLQIAPGECLICYQMDTGTASDQRIVSITGHWSEYDNA